MKGVGAFNFVLLYLITLNLEHGPDAEEMRYWQLRECMAACFKNLSPEECPLFEDMAPQMVLELEAGDVVTFPRVDRVENELWDWMKGRASFAKLGRRTSMCRFGGALAGMKRVKPLWTVQLFERTFCSIELDFLKGTKFLKRLTLQPGAAEGVDGVAGPTDPTRVQIDDRSLRGCCQNAMVVSTLTLQTRTTLD